MHSTTRRSPTALLLALGTLALFGCSDATTAPATVPTSQVLAPRFAASSTGEVQRAIAAQERNNAALLRIPGVVGTAVGILPNGKAGVRVFVKDAEVRSVPAVVDDIPVVTEVTGLIIALSDPTLRARPAPIGFSVGHPLITAGTMGALVRDAGAQLFVLSNNHVLANQNDANIGDAMLQPGPFDGGTSADQIGTLADFQAINFSGGSNTIDAAIARVTNPADVSSSTPLDDGYGQPSGTIYGDANNDRVFDDKTTLLGLNVQKYGRTTKLTQGQITGINGTISVCYEVLLGIFCVKSATFVDQLIIGSGTFSGGGDSGSLIVTNDATRNPVGLLFAGGSTSTIANRIDLVLNRFAVSVDGGSSGPPPSVTDIAVTGVSAPASVTLGSTVNVSVTVRNAGNQNVASSFNVTLADQTASTTIGSQAVSGLTTGATKTLNFSWNTTGAATGAHTLVATQDLVDDNAANNIAQTTSSVGTATAAIHIGDLDAMTSISGSQWSATVEVTVHDSNHQPLNGATVVGNWTGATLASDTCTTGELGGNGTCIFLAPGLSLKTKKSVSFSVTSVTMTGKTYQSASNHDPETDSNGTTIKVTRP